MGSRVKAYYGILADEKTVVMEMAQAAGIALVEEAQRNPGKATTYGVGEMIRDAVSRRLPQIHHRNRRKRNK